MRDVDEDDELAGGDEAARHSHVRTMARVAEERTMSRLWCELARKVVPGEKARVDEW